MHLVVYLNSCAADYKLYFEYLRWAISGYQNNEFRYPLSVAVGGWMLLRGI